MNVRSSMSPLHPSLHSSSHSSSSYSSHTLLPPSSVSSSVPHDDNDDDGDDDDKNDEEEEKRRKRRIERIRSRASTTPTSRTSCMLFGWLNLVITISLLVNLYYYHSKYFFMSTSSSTTTTTTMTTTNSATTSSNYFDIMKMTKNIDDVPNSSTSFLNIDSTLTFSDPSSLVQGGNIIDNNHLSTGKNDKNIHVTKTIIWRIIVTANAGYEQDLVMWYYHCQRCVLCHTDPIIYSDEYEYVDLVHDEDDTPTTMIQRTTTMFVTQVHLYVEDEYMLEKYGHHNNNDAPASRNMSSPSSTTASRLLFSKVSPSWLETKFKPMPSNIGKDENTNKTIIDLLEKDDDDNFTKQIIKAERLTYDQNKLFFRMMSRRPSILLSELRQAHEEEKDKDMINNNKHPKDEKMKEGTGTSSSSSSSTEIIVLFSDLDVFILQDPRPIILQYETIPTSANGTVTANSIKATTNKTVELWGTNAMNDKTGPFNGGFVLFRPTTTNIRLVKEWKSILESHTRPSPNQFCFNRMIKKYLPIRKLLSKQLFPPGKYIFDNPISNGEEDDDTNTQFDIFLHQQQHQNLTATYKRGFDKKLKRKKITKHDIKKMKKLKYSLALSFWKNQTSFIDFTTRTTTSTTTTTTTGGTIVAYHNNYCERPCDKIQRAIDMGLWISNLTSIEQLSLLF